MIIVSSNRICLKSHSGLSRKKRTVTSEFLRLVAVLLSVFVFSRFKRHHVV